MTQKDLGGIIGVTDSAIGLWENGKRMPEPDTLERIADYFDVSVDYLLGRTDDPRPLRKRIEEAVQDDPELKEFWDAFLSKRELRVAFRTMKDLDAATLRKVVRIIKAIEEEEGSYPEEE